MLGYSSCSSSMYPLGNPLSCQKGMSQEHISVYPKQLVREASLYTCFPDDLL